jgi:hypothetical protein
VFGPYIYNLLPNTMRYFMILRDFTIASGHV